MKQITYTLATMLALVLLNPSCRKKDDKTNSGEQTIQVGALLSLTGNWSSLGITSQAAIDIALEDINAHMADLGSKYRFAVTVYDTKLDTTIANKYIAEAGAAGSQFVLGPQSSAEAGAVRNYANTNNMLVVSQGSTAGVLSIEGDNLFRFCPDDHIEGQAMAKTIYKDSIRALITVARNDAGNKGLQTSTGNAFGALGGSTAPIIPYSTDANVDFTTTLTNIKANILDYKNTHPTSEIAVYLASFDECITLFQKAANDPVLSSVRWYGGDGTALSAALTSNAAAADFAIATRYIAPTFGLPAVANTVWEPLSEKIKAKTGIAPDAFALATYDALWVIALSYNALDVKPEFAKLKAEFPVQAGKYFGATGSTTLNAAGDRSEGSYDYWGIQKDGNNYKWVVVGASK